MKGIKRILAAVLVILMLLPMSTAWINAATISSGLDGETSRTVKTLYNGVTSTNIKTSTSSKYNLQNFDIVEFDLAQTDLYVDVTNGQPYANQKKTTESTVTYFNTYNGEGKTAIAAINGDLWTMPTHAPTTGSSAVVTKSTTLPRGFSVYDGEIVCSSHMEQETPYEGEFWSFGVTEDSVPMIGCPELAISIKNNTKGATVAADGLNRLPANNALVVYSDKGCSTTNALADAYEVVIDCSYDYTVKHGASVTGTVVGIYNSGSAENPEMKPNRFILTARGTRTMLIQNFAVNDSITINFSVTERYNRNTEGWQNAHCAVGGHMPFVVDGVKWGMNSTSTAGYPSTIIGIKNDGKVCFITNDGRQSSFSKGLRFDDYWDFADDMDLNTAFILDGGGSTNLIELGANGYTVVNSPSDGSVRSVINSVILSAGPRNTGRGDYEVRVPSDNLDLTNLYFATDDAFMTLTNFTETKIERTIEGAKMTVKDFLSGPSVAISYGLPNTTSNNSNSVLADRRYSHVSKSEYPYLVLDMSVVSASSSMAHTQVLYLSAGSKKGMSANGFVQYNFPYNNNGWNKYTLNPGLNTAYSGSLNQLILNYLVAANGITVQDNDYVILRSARLAKTAEEAAAMTDTPSMQTVTFNANGGVCDQTKKYAVKGEKYGVMPIPTRDGYEFTGWYTAATGGTKITEDSIANTSSTRTLYAQWVEAESEPTLFYIYFDPNGGDGLALNYEIAPGQTYEEAVGGLPDIPSRNGYTFGGWYNEKYDYTLYMGDTFSVTEDVTFKAIWIPLKGDYRSTTSLNIRSGPDTSYGSVGSLADGDIFAVTDSNGHWGYGTKAGTNITGWASYNYLNYIYIDEQVKGFESTGLTWKRLAEFKIDLNGGTFDSTKGITQGAVTSSNLGLDNSSDDIVVYIYHPANLLIDPSDYSFNTYLGCVYVNGETSMVQATNLGDIMNVILRSCTKQDHKPATMNFIGLRDFTAEEFISADTWVDLQLMNGSTYEWTLNWESAVYTMTFDVNGGIMPEDYTTSYEFRADQKIIDVIGGYPVPTKEGYIFDGWQRDDYAPDFWQGGWGTQPYTFNKNISVTAVWTEIPTEGPIAELGEDEDGNLHVYVDGEIMTDGLYKVDQDYYYALRDGSLARDRKLYTYKNNTNLVSSYRYFGTDCKMDKDGWLELDDDSGRKYYFVDAHHATGFTKIDGYYYFFNTNSGEMYRNADLYVGKNSYGIETGSQHFGADGKMTTAAVTAAAEEVSMATSTPTTSASGLDNYVQNTSVLAINTAAPISLPESAEGGNGSDDDEQ